MQAKEPKNVVFFDGNSLTFILRDENLKKSFLLLCSMSNFMIASKTSSQQKALLVKEIRLFNEISNLGKVLGIVSSTHD
jgi:hypothetical protein